MARRGPRAGRPWVAEKHWAYRRANSSHGIRWAHWTHEFVGSRCPEKGNTKSYTSIWRGLSVGTMGLSLSARVCSEIHQKVCIFRQLYKHYLTVLSICYDFFNRPYVCNPIPTEDSWKIRAGNKNECLWKQNALLDCCLKHFYPQYRYLPRKQFSPNG